MSHKIGLLGNLSSSWRKHWKGILIGGTPVVASAVASVFASYCCEWHKLKLQREYEARQKNEKIEEKRIEELIRQDNTYIATAQAWSHCMGYTRQVLPELGDKIQKSEFYREDCFPVKQFNLIPQDGKGTIKQIDLPKEYQFKYIGELEPIKASRGSYLGREYKPNVYSITDPSSHMKKKYYFVADIPYAISVLGKLEESRILEKKERINEMGMFRMALRRVVNMTVDDSCKSLYSQVYLEENMTGKEKAETILQNVKHECQTKKTTQQPEKVITDTRTTIYLDYDRGICSEKKLAENLIKKPLQDKGYTVLDGHPESSESGRTVLVLSKKRLGQMRYNIDKWIAELDKSLPKKASLIVVFADDMTRDKIPNGLQSLVHIFLSCSEPSFNEKLLKEVASDHMDGRECIPDSAYRGLAYAYVLNYLEKSLDVKNEDDSFEWRLQEIHKDYKGIPLYKKLLLTLPHSFLRRDNKNLEKDENNRAISGFEKLKENVYYRQVGGTKQRGYQLIPYRVEDNWWQVLLHPLSKGKKFIFVAEYPNPLVLLSEIQQYAHWSDEKLKTEVDNFVGLTKALIDKSEVRDRVCFLSIDDEKGYGYVIREQLMNHLKEKQRENENDFM